MRVRTQRQNANRHTARGMPALDTSIQQDGWIGAITVAADGETFDGSARVEIAGDVLVDAIVVRSDGSRPIVHVREDIATADDPKAVRLGLAANRVASLNLEWEPAVLSAIADQAIDVGALWTPEEWVMALPAHHHESQTPEMVWQGMPDFTQEDKTPWKTLHVHFACAEDYAAFAAKIDQSITTATRSLWFPSMPRGSTTDHTWDIVDDT